jgi:hypothetical protein
MLTFAAVGGKDSEEDEVGTEERNGKARVSYSHDVFLYYSLGTTEFMLRLH